MATVTSQIPSLGNPGNFEELEASFASLQVWLATLSTNFQAIQAAVLTGNIIVSSTRANVPTTLALGDEGRIYYVTDFDQFVRWSGTAWQFMGGTNGYIAHFTAAPGTGWALCDGSTVNKLVVGAAALTTASVTLPNLTGTEAYLKTAGSYTGSPVAAAGASGATAPGTDSQGSHTHTGTTDADGDHNHGGSTGSYTAADAAQAGAGQAVSITHAHSIGASGTHTHGFTTGSGGSHSHTVDSHTHGIGTLDPRHLNTLPYFRL